jgi:hypothetical protein
MTTTVLLIHVAATLAMVGLIWFVQIVHYALFNEVGATAFPAYHRGHMRRTTWVVAPLMLIELVTAIWLVGTYADARLLWPWWNLGLLAAIWASTFLSQVPQHRRLAAGFDDRAQRRLLSGNWFRTLAWTVRGLLVLWALSQTIGS